MSTMLNEQSDSASGMQRPRLLILSYDSEPNIRLLWPLVDQLAAQADCLFLVQFPETLSKLRKRGFHARSIRSVLGWEHGASFGPKDGRSSSSTDLSDAVEYEHKAFPEIPVQQLTAQANDITHRFKELIDSWNPALVLAWNGHTLPYKPCLAYARDRGIAVRVLERGFFPESLFIDKDGTNCASSVKKDFHQPVEGVEANTPGLIERLRDNYSPIVAQNTGSLGEGENLRARLGLDDDAFLFLIPEQLEHDSNTVLFCDNVKSNREVLQKVSDAIEAQGYTNAKVLYKTHPELSSRTVMDEGLNFDHVQVVSDISIVRLLSECDAVITRNSTVGFEALLFGKRCIVLGKSIYSGLGITDDVESMDQLADVVAQVYMSSALPDCSESNLLLLVNRLYRNHHYFVEPEKTEATINQAMVDAVLTEARNSTIDENSAGTSWTRLPWSVRVGEWIWSFRLRCRSIKAFFDSGLDA